MRRVTRWRLRWPPKDRQRSHRDRAGLAVTGGAGLLGLTVVLAVFGGADLVHGHSDAVRAGPADLVCPSPSGTEASSSEVPAGVLISEHFDRLHDPLDLVLDRSLPLSAPTNTPEDAIAGLAGFMALVPEFTSPEGSSPEADDFVRIDGSESLGWVDFAVMNEDGEPTRLAYATLGEDGVWRVNDTIGCASLMGTEDLGNDAFNENDAEGQEVDASPSATDEPGGPEA